MTRLSRIPSAFQRASPEVHTSSGRSVSSGDSNVSGAHQVAESQKMWSCMEVQPTADGWTGPRTVMTWTSGPSSWSAIVRLAAQSASSRMHCVGHWLTASRTSSSNGPGTLA